MKVIKITFKKSNKRQEIRQIIENYTNEMLKFPNINSTEKTDYFRFKLRVDLLGDLLNLLSDYLDLIIRIDID